MSSDVVRSGEEKSYSMHKAAVLIAALSLASQALALVRDKLLAHIFGAGETLDVYYAAFRIPDLLYAMLSSMLAVIIFLPLYSERKHISQKLADAFVHSTFTVFLLFSSLIAVVLFFVMPYLTPMIAPGFSVAQLQQLTLLSQILLLSPILLGISNMVGSLVQSTKKMLFYALAPIAYNIGIIVGVILLVPSFGLVGVVYGVIFGAVLHIAVQLPVLYKERISIKLTRFIDWKAITELFSVAFPRIATLGLIQLSQLYLVASSTLLATGSVAIFSFAFNIQTVPLSLIGVSYSVAAFPVLVQMFQKNDTNGLLLNVYSAMRHIVFWSIPVICFAIVLRAHIVRILYGSGEFTWTDTRLTAAVFAVMVLSLVAQGFSLLFMRALYAMRYSYIPLVIQVLSFLATILVTVGGMYVWNTYPMIQFFVEDLFRVGDLQGTIVIVIGLAHAIGAIVLSVGLWVMLRYFVVRSHSMSGLRQVVIYALGASLIGATVSYWVLVFLSPLISLDTFWGVTLHALSALFAGGLAWFLILYILGSKELHEFLFALQRRFWRVRVVQPEQSEL